VNYHFCVDRECSGMELDEFLCRSFPLLPKRVLRRLVRNRRVLVDGEGAATSQRLRSDEVVSVELDEEEGDRPPPPAPSFEVPILFEDDHLLVVDKPADLNVEPDRWDETRPSLLGGLVAMGLGRGGGPAEEEPSGEPFRPRLVHRLDRDTSGVVLVAKTIEAERRLRRAFDEGEVGKTYLALVEGESPLADGESELVELPIGPDRKKSGRMCVRDDGKPSRTRIRVRQRFRGFTLLESEPLTGRTHQLRVHLSAIGFPLAVDPLYGRRRALSLSEIKSDYRPKRGRAESPLIDRLTLHAQSVECPIVESARAGGTPADLGPGAALAGSSTGARLRAEAPLPRDFERVLKQLAKVRPPRR
jgi:23S rRNA pseudouridine1911/1915/1917 synthase